MQQAARESPHSSLRSPHSSLRTAWAAACIRNSSPAGSPKGRRSTVSPKVSQARTLARDLKSLGADQRRKAAEGLSSLGSYAAPSGPRLASCLKDGNQEVREGAARALAALGSAGEPHAQALAARFGRADRSALGERARQECAFVLAKMGLAGAEAMAGLLEHPKAEVRALAAETLGSLGDAGSPHLEAVVALLGDSEARVRRAAVEAVAALGGVRLLAGCVLQDGLAPAEAECRAMAAAALGRGSGEAAELTAQRCAETLARRLAGRAGEARRAAETLRRLGCAGAGAAAGQLAHHDARVRLASVEALLQMGPPAAAAHAPTIAERLLDDDALVRARSAEALGRLGEAAAPHLDALALLLWDGDTGVRGAATAALARLAPFNGRGGDVPG